MLFLEIFHTRFTFGTPLVETILIGKAIKPDVVVNRAWHVHVGLVMFGIWTFLRVELVSRGNTF